MTNITHITYELVEPQIPNKPEYVITAHIETNNDTTAKLNYKLMSIELDPDYMTTDRLYKLLANHYKSYNIRGFQTLLDDFVIEFILHIRKEQR